MYPNLDRQTTTKLECKKTLSMSQSMQSTVIDLQKNFQLTSVKPHLNYHQCQFSLVVNKQMAVPIRIVFLRSYPKERPLIYATKWLQHPLIKPYTNEIVYDTVFQWTETSRILDLFSKILVEFSKTLPNDKTDIDKGYYQLDCYLQQIEQLRAKQVSTQPPPPPRIDLENILKTFEHQDGLVAQCEEKDALYQITARDYAENVARVRCISERFGKGKILRQLEKELQNQKMNTKNQNVRVQDLLGRYYEGRKKYHRTKILKELYLES